MRDTRLIVLYYMDNTRLINTAEEYAAQPSGGDGGVP